MSHSNTRQLVAVRRVSSVAPIRRSRYDIVTVDGWKIVVRREEGFHKGQLVVYFEIDSFLPNNRYFWEYCAGAHTQLGDEIGFLVTTTMICGHVSQGLVFRLDAFEELMEMFAAMKKCKGEDIAEEELMAMSLQEVLDVKKWKYNDNNDNTENLGRPPIFFPQPGCQRAQNLPTLFEQHGEQRYQVTEKLDGTPMSIYAIKKSSQWYPVLPPLPNSARQTGPTRVGVCSRQHDLVDTSASWFWRTAKQQRIMQNIHTLGQNIVVQGELCGSSIMGNSMGFGPQDHKFFVFDIYNIDKQQRLPPSQVSNICSKLGWDHVPVIFDNIKLASFAEDLRDLLAKAEGVGMRGRMREGLVFKEVHSSFSFKAISNAWLLQTGKQ